MTPKTAACCLAFLLAWTRWASAQSIILPPSKTNTLIQVVSGGTGQLSNALGDIYVGRTNQDGQGPATISIRRGLIEFNIASEIPAGSTITGVTLTVNDVRGDNGNQPASLYPMLRGWGQGTSYFNGGQGCRPPMETQPDTTHSITQPILRPALRGRFPADNPASTLVLRRARRR